MISVPIKAPKAPGGFEMQQVPIIDPHRLMHILLTFVGVDIPTSRVREYWRKHRHELQEDWAVHSPASDEHIPFAVYGDSAKIREDGTKVIGVFLSMPAVWRPKSTRCARWCVFALEEHKQFGHHTLHSVFRRITYSCNILFHGVDPDDANLTLCGGRKFTVTEIKGDWQWLKLTMRFRSSWQGVDSVCFLCDAKGRSGDPKQLHYCLDEHPNWTAYNLTTFLADQMTLPEPCALTSFVPLDVWGAFCFKFVNCTHCVRTCVDRMAIGYWTASRVTQLRSLHPTLWIPPGDIATLQYARHQPWAGLRREWLIVEFWFILIWYLYSVSLLCNVGIYQIKIKTVGAHGLPRIALCEANYFGRAAGLQDHLDLAYQSFKSFCKAEKISTSQPPFKTYHVPESV